MSQIVVSCEMPIQWVQLEQFSLVYITNTCSIWYFAQFVCNAIFTSLHVPAGAWNGVGWSGPYLRYESYRGGRIGRGRSVRLGIDNTGVNMWTHCILHLARLGVLELWMLS